MSEFRREVRWEPGYDHRADPEKAQYGCRGLQIRWMLHGPRATMQFLLMTPWLPTWEAFDKKNKIFDIIPADVGCHADAPQYKGQFEMDCKDRPAGKCYYDGSGLAANDLFKILLTEGEEAVWKELQERYNERFSE